MLCLPLYVENETKRHDTVVERMGRLKEKYGLVSHLWSLNETPFSKDVQAESRDLYERYRV